ncbi:MAG TPA: FAD:protein FMN transferase [Povalibacter sp.]
MSANAAVMKRGPCAVSLVRNQDHWAGRFAAMACPCDVLIESGSQTQARQLADAIAECAWRIERKFSRYRPGSVVHSINDTAGTAVTVDEETANLLNFAATLTQLSEGRFDITSGALRQAWTFDGGDRLPTQEQIDALLPLIGWHRVQWTRPVLQLQTGMQIDFGGIGKEYAVDTAAALANTLAPGVSCLVNFGGDVACVNARSDGQPWHVGIERADRLGAAAHVVNLHRGGIATSGDSRRFVLNDGRRYSHILDARTGWPVRNAPHSVTVVADTCSQAGSVTTLAMLQGRDAETFLKSSGMRYWLQ